MDEERLHGFLYGSVWVMFHGISELPSGPPPRGRPDTNYGKVW